MDKFRNKYRITSTRLQSWNYGWNAAYFVTICTDNRKYFFGDISNGRMKLSEIGKLADQYWLEIPNHFGFVKLDAHVVMPDHIHGMIIIDKQDDDHSADTPNLGVSTDQGNPDTQQPQKTKNQSQTAAASKKWKPGTLGSIINQYKRICTINSRKINADFAWQSRFHDHIIRDDKSYQRIRNYIINNPKNWKEK